jgi:hypothetical protein
MAPPKLLACLVLGLLASAAHGQADGCATPAAAQAVENAALTRGYDTGLIASRRCLGSLQGDADPLVATFNGQTPPAKDVLARKQHLHDALVTLEKYAREQAALPANQDSWNLVDTRLRAELDNLQGLDDFISPGDFLANSFWPDNGSPGGVVANGAILLLAPTGCAAPPAPCPAYEPRKALIRVFNLANRLGDYADADRFALHLKDARLQNARWSSYFNDTRPQYWWEIIVNGKAMQKQYCDADPATQIQRGFCRVPESQWIVLHPSAALQWVDGADSQQDLKPAFIVEVFGRNSWTWKESTPSRQRGWSLLAAYSNRGADQDKWSYGLMLRYGKDLNLGLTTTPDNEFGILVSARLAGRFFEQKQQYLDYLKAKEKPNWLELLD